MRRMSLSLQMPGDAKSGATSKMDRGDKVASESRRRTKLLLLACWKSSLWTFFVVVRKTGKNNDSWVSCLLG